MFFGRKETEQEKMVEHLETRLEQYTEEIVAPRLLNLHQCMGIFWMRTQIASFYFLLICADENKYGDEEWEATGFAQYILSGMIPHLNGFYFNTEEGEVELEKLRSMTLLPFYRFFGETMFKPLGGDANAIVAEMETFFRDDGSIWDDSDWRDMVMAHLLKVFDGAYDRSETQEEVIDYLCKRWNVDVERYERLSEKIYTKQETIAMADKIADMLAKAGKVSFVDPPIDAV